MRKDMEGRTTRELAEEAVADGWCPRVFDYALPQGWVDDVHDRTGVWPQTLGFVWGYPESGLPGHIWGVPIPLTDAAEALLVRVEVGDVPFR